MKRGFQYKVMALNFSGLFLVFIVWLTTAMTLKKLESVVGDLATAMIIAGLAALTATGLIGCLIAAEIIKPLTETVRKLENMTTEIQNQKKHAENIASTMKELEVSGKNFEHITMTINDIRFQVHLLALNAAIEAARAEEKSSGFAMVAEELKNLANKTAESSKSIQTEATRNMESVKKCMAMANETIAFSAVIMAMINELELEFTKISAVPGNKKRMRPGPFKL